MIQLWEILNDRRQVVGSKIDHEKFRNLGKRTVFTCVSYVFHKCLHVFYMCLIFLYMCFHMCLHMFTFTCACFAPFCALGIALFDGC